MPELIDIFDGNHRHIGEFERVSAHQQGLWHHTFHCWIVGESDGVPFVVLQLRSPTKKNYPDMLDITAAGHLEAGESPEDGIREIEEELGVSVDPANLISLGIKHDVMDEPSGVRNREFAHVFLLRDDRPIGQYRLGEDEVSGLVRMKVEDGLELFAGRIAAADCDAIRISNGKIENSVRRVAIGDLIPRVDPYYRKIFILADLHSKGYRELSI